MSEIITIQERIDRHHKYITLFFPDVEIIIRNNLIKIYDKDGNFIYRVGFLVDTDFDRNERLLINSLVEIEKKLK